MERGGGDTSLGVMSDVAEAVARLRAEWRLDFARVRPVLAALAGGATVAELVAASGLPRRDVEAVLAVLAPFSNPDGERVAVPGLAVPDHRSFPGDAELAERMVELAAGRPPARWRLDHVPATAGTMARRALYLAGQYELEGAAVLCLGDHDLTSLAVGCAGAGADLTVVDIDEPVLDHLTASAARLGLELTAAWADLRLALPPSLTGTADLVFTDPPYTLDGMRLFLVRALEALGATGHDRIAFCFGTGERHLVKALELQSLLAGLHLVIEAVLPGFNRYDGAEAIGARSDLYLCRPTTGARLGEAARPVRSDRPRRNAARIYTRGPAAREASGRRLPDAVAAAALAAAGHGPAVLVGEGWGDAGVGLPGFVGRVAAWATAARRGAFPFPGTPVVNTDPDFGAAAPRLVLLAAPERAVLVVPRRHVDDLRLPLLAVAYDIAAVPSGPGGDPAVVTVTRHDRPPAGETEAVLRHVVLHPGAKVGNAWRDAVLAVARQAGVAMTKNEARGRLAGAGLDPSVQRLRLWELPIAQLRLIGAGIPEPDEWTRR